MGRIKTTFIKRKTKELNSRYGDKFTTVFEQNKKLTTQYVKVPCKKLKNTIAGYMTRLKKQEK